MNIEPHVKQYFDDEEKYLIESMEYAIQKDDFTPISHLTPDRLTMLHEVADNTLNKQSTPVTLSILCTDLIRFKARALREGISYQTWMQSALHKAVNH